MIFLIRAWNTSHGLSSVARVYYYLRLRLKNWLVDYNNVIVHSIDRLARDLPDLQDIIEKINGKSASISFQMEGLTFKVDKADPIATLQLRMMGAFSQFERAIIRKLHPPQITCNYMILIDNL